MNLLKKLALEKYKKKKFVKKLGGLINSQFYQFIKKENRWGHFQGVYLELENGEQEEISAEEKAIHDIYWLSPKEVQEFLNVEDMRMIWVRLSQPNSVFTGEGILVN